MPAINGGIALVTGDSQCATAKSGGPLCEKLFCGVLPVDDSPVVEQLECARSATACPGGQCGQSAGAGAGAWP
jgi:hypothetical protein